jgi:hypothetical protein
MGVEAVESLRRGNFVDKMAVDVQQYSPVIALSNDMSIEKLVVQSARLEYGSGIHTALVGALCYSS